MRKKIERVLDMVFIILKWIFLITVFMGFLGVFVFLKEFTPVTRKNFKNYQVYLDDRRVRESYGSFYFKEELPIDAEDVKYYSEYAIFKCVTAYSMILPQNTYMDFKESRINYYAEEADCQECCSLLYAYHDDGYQYIDDSEWYDTKLDYVDNVLHKLEGRQQYYLAVLMKTNTGKGECYSGIIANDSDSEIIEFSANLPKDYGEHKESESHMSVIKWIISGLMIALIVIIIKGMYVLDKKLENKSNKKQI
ncbi:MAG: hypothetical protein NC092_01265 [Butyrivibrio sp.]|nr:hypothetical protein [Muribaculum sp.]MCM1551302.1 hypothetical protein [Butyrivibrio sp.]